MASENKHEKTSECLTFSFMVAQNWISCTIPPKPILMDKSSAPDAIVDKMASTSLSFSDSRDISHATTSEGKSPVKILEPSEFPHDPLRLQTTAAMVAPCSPSVLSSNHSPCHRRYEELKQGDKTASQSSGGTSSPSSMTKNEKSGILKQATTVTPTPSGVCESFRLANNTTDGHKVVEPCSGRRYITRSVIRATKTPSKSKAFGELSVVNSSFTEDIDKCTTSNSNIKRSRRRSSISKPCKKPGGKKSGNINTKIFPFILARFLREVGASHPEHVYWSENGESFFIRVNPKANYELIGQLVAPYFKHANYDALRRQLNLYGFQRVSSGPYVLNLT